MHKNRNLNPDQLLDLIFQIDDHLSHIQIAYQEVVINLVIGNTGAGKSTLVNFLLGNQLVSRMNPLSGQYILDLAQNNQGPAIGVNLVSQTILPNIVQDQNGIHTYCDCPGFRDNRSIGDEIGNAYYIHNTASVMEGRVLLVVPHSDMIQPRLLTLTALAESVSRMFLNLNSLQNSISLIITQNYNPHYNSNIALNMLNAVVNDVSINMSNGARLILGYLRQNIIVTKTPIEEGIYEENPEDLLATISQVPIANLMTRPVISPEARIEAIGLVNSVREHIQDQFDIARNEQRRYVDEGYFVKLIVEQQKEYNQMVNYRKTRDDYQKISDFLERLEIPNVDTINQIYTQLQENLMQSYNDEIRNLITNAHNELINIVQNSDRPKELLNFLVNIKLEDRMSRILEYFREFDDLFADSQCQDDISRLLQQVNDGQFQDTQFTLSRELQSTLNAVLFNTMSLPITREVDAGMVMNETDSGITYAGTSIKISDIKKWHAKHTAIYAYKDFYLDQDIKLNGPASLSIISPIWYLKKTIEINLSGQKGASHSYDAASGSNGYGERGGNGSNGKDGEHGKDGGTFYGIAHKLFANAGSSLNIDVSGGDGGNGQKGGDGGKGGKGRDYDERVVREEGEVYLSKLTKVRTMDKIPTPYLVALATKMAKMTISDVLKELSSNPDLLDRLKKTEDLKKRVSQGVKVPIDPDQVSRWKPVPELETETHYVKWMPEKTKLVPCTVYYPDGIGGSGGDAGVGGKPGKVSLLGKSDKDDLLRSLKYVTVKSEEGKMGQPGAGGRGGGQSGKYMEKDFIPNFGDSNDKISDFLQSLIQITGNHGYEKIYKKALLSQFSQGSIAEQMTQDEVRVQLQQSIDQESYGIQNALSFANVLEFHDNNYNPEANNALEIVNNITNNGGGSSYNIILGHEHIVAVVRLNNVVYVIDGIEGNHGLTTRLSGLLENAGVEVRVINTHFQTDFHLVNQCGHIAIRSLIAAVDYIRNNDDFSTEQLRQHITANLRENLIEKKPFKAGADIDPGPNYDDDSDDDNEPAVEANNILRIDNITSATRKYFSEHQGIGEEELSVNTVAPLIFDNSNHNQCLYMLSKNFEEAEIHFDNYIEFGLTT